MPKVLLDIFSSPHQFINISELWAMFLQLLYVL